MMKPPTTNDDCIECTLDLYQPSPSHNVPLPSIANARITKMKMTILSMIAISNTTEILKMSISLSFSVRMDFVCRREAMLQPCIHPYHFRLYPNSLELSLPLFIFLCLCYYDLTNFVEPLFIIICFLYSHVNDFTCLQFHMLSIITCYSISHVYYYLLCMMN